jgi:hypothetical protein
VEPERFQRNFLLKNNGGTLITPFLNYFNTKNVDTIIQYDDYYFTNSFQFSKQGDKDVILKETFIDYQTNHIRQNEQTLYMDSIENIQQIAQKTGFISHSKVNMKSYNGDENQYLVVFERIM